MNKDLLMKKWQWYPVSFLLGWLFVGDFIRKLIPGQPSAVVLVGDFILLVVYVLFGIFLWRRKLIWRPPFLLPLILFAVFVTIKTIGTAPNFIISALAFRTYLWYIPLLFVGYYLFPNKEKLLQFIRIITYVAIPLFIFAFGEYLFWDASIPFLRPFLDGHQVHDFWGVRDGVPLVPSVFGSGQRYGLVSVILLFLGLSLCFSLKKEQKSFRKIMTIAATASAFGGMMFSGSRSAFMMTIIGLLLFCIFRKFDKNKKIKSFLWGAFNFLVIFLAIIVFLIITSQLGFKASMFYLDSFRCIDNDILARLIREFNFVSPYITVSGTSPYSLSQGIQKFTGVKPSDVSVPVEAGLPRLLFNLGLIGSILFYGLWGCIIYYGSRIAQGLEKGIYKDLGIAIIVIFIVILLRSTFVHLQAFFDQISLVMLWLFVGILYKLSESTDEKI